MQPAVSSADIRKANFKSLPDQKMSSKNPNEWQKRTSKHYFPCLGNETNPITKKDTFILFGLHKENMLNDCKRSKKAFKFGHYYKQLSKKNNCSGKCLSLLESGGSKLFSSLKPLFLTTPDDLKHYSEKVVNIMDRLNQCSFELEAIIDKTKNITDSTQSLKELANDIEIPAKNYTMESNIRSVFFEVSKHMRRLEKTKETVKDLMPVAQQLVLSIHKLHAMTDQNFHRFLTPSLQAFIILREKMQSAYRRSLE